MGNKIKNGENMEINTIKEEKKFYKENWFMWISLIFIAPLGIFLMWKYHTNMKKNIKIILTIIFAFIFLVAIIGESSDNSATTKSDNDTDVDKYVYLEGSDASDAFGFLTDFVDLEYPNTEPREIFDGMNEYYSYDEKYSVEINAEKETDKIASITVIGPNKDEAMNFFMALGRVEFDGKDKVEMANFIIENIDTDAEKIIGNIKISSWDNGHGRPVIKIEGKDLDKYLENKN